MKTPNKTVATVPLSDLLAIAALGAAMRKAQRAYFKRRKDTPYASADAEWRAARDLEKRFDSVVADALARDRQTIPGMEGGGE